jgi:hypothetical protein
VSREGGSKRGLACAYYLVYQQICATIAIKHNPTSSQLTGSLHSLHFIEVDEKAAFSLPQEKSSCFIETTDITTYNNHAPQIYCRCGKERTTTDIKAHTNHARYGRESKPSTIAHQESGTARLLTKIW